MRSTLARLRRSRIAATLVTLLLGAALVAPAAGAARPTRTLVPIGSDYTEATLQRFAQAAAQHDSSDTIDLLVLPITYATDPFVITPEERAENLELADERRAQLAAACAAIKRAEQSCRAVLAPILVRDDAVQAGNLDLFVADLDGMYILGGDQTIAMQVVADTPTERRMEAAYKNGAVVGGNSAGNAVESRTMIAGYIGDNGPENGLQQGIVDLWQPDGRSDRTRGLIFGLRDQILEQHTFQRGRIGRLLNVVWQTGLPGVGVDAETAATIQNESLLTDVTGRSATVIIDPNTYHANGRYAGPTNSLAIHRVATHLIPPGGYGFDLKRMRPLVHGQAESAPNLGGRDFDALRLPAGYGPLLLSGDISADAGGPVAQRFVARSGGKQARLVVLATGYADSTAAQAQAQAFAAALQPQVAKPVQAFVLDPAADLDDIRHTVGDADGILLTAPDQSTVAGALASADPVVRALRRAWRHGAALLADNAAAAALGNLMSIDAPPTDDSLEDDAVNDFRPDSVTLQAGLGFLRGLAIEPRLMPDRHWGRLYNLLNRDHRALAVGIDVGSALELSQSGGRVWGSSAVVLLDGRAASFAVGNNGALSARYVILDSFVAGDRVQP
jgi:cyanophycinase